MGRGLNLVSRGAEPKSQRCRYPGATDGRHGRCRAKGCPQIGSLQRYTTSAGPCSPPRARRRRLPAENIVSARVLLRCYCADTSDSLRCDARSTRRGAGTASTAAEHATCAPHAHFGCAVTPRVAERRRRWVLQASTRSRRTRIRARVRVSQGPPLPRPVFRYTTERAGRLGGARPTDWLRVAGPCGRESAGRPEARRSLRDAERRPCGAL